MGLDQSPVGLKQAANGSNIAQMKLVDERENNGKKAAPVEIINGGNHNKVEFLPRDVLQLPPSND